MNRAFSSFAGRLSRDEKGRLSLLNTFQIFLSPNTERPGQLRAVYGRAFREATELYIASAYLTDWDAGQRLGRACQRVVFLVGTDFGLSRRAAMRSVLRWIPKRRSFLLS